MACVPCNIKEKSHGTKILPSWATKDTTLHTEQHSALLTALHSTLHTALHTGLYSALHTILHTALHATHVKNKTDLVRCFCLKAWWSLLRQQSIASSRMRSSAAQYPAAILYGSITGATVGLSGEVVFWLLRWWWIEEIEFFWVFW